MCSCVDSNLIIPPTVCGYDGKQPHLELPLVIQVAAYFAAWLLSMLASSDDDPLDLELAFSYN